MKFFLDENMSLLAGERLGAAGHDVVHVLSAGLTGKSDIDVFAVAQEQGRILVT